jgi:uncharacterized membrane protein YfcA
MASPHPPSVIRANTFLYLYLTDVLMIAVLSLSGHLVASAAVIGVLLIPPYMIGNLIGARVFRPEAERIFRGVAYTIIAASALSGLPFFD